MIIHLYSPYNGSTKSMKRGRCEPRCVVVTMATRNTITWFVGCCGCDAAVREEEATQATHHLHEPAAPAADQEVSADTVPRPAWASWTRRLAWTYTNTGQKCLLTRARKCGGFTRWWRTSGRPFVRFVRLSPVKFIKSFARWQHPTASGLFHIVFDTRYTYLTNL